MRMYYLDFHSLYRYAPKGVRVEVRRRLSAKKRDEFMAHRLKMQRNMCFYCGVEIGMSAHLDHLIPVLYGGTNRKINFVAACRGCNMFKMTDQIEITNPHTIKDYLTMQEAYAKWQIMVAKIPHLKRYQPKRVRLYGMYHAELFKSIKIEHILASR